MPARPPRIRPGDVVAIVAPAGPVREDDLAKGLEILAARYTLRVDERVHARNGHLAGPDDDRLAALQAAISAPDVEAVIAARGGYGTMRIVDRLDLSPLRASPKIVVGSSDLTVLGCALAREGHVSIHGPMVESIGRREGPEDFDRLVRLLEDPAPPDDSGVALDAIRPGTAEGPVLGGNLSLLAALAGSGTVPDLAGAILFLEDVGERPYRIDRMLTQLLRARALDGITGVLVGDLTDCNPKSESPGPLEVIAERLGALGVPIAAGYPAGHGGRFRALPHGARARIESGRIRWLEGAVT